MALTMHRRALGEANGEGEEGMEGERRGRRHSCTGGRKESGSGRRWRRDRKEYSGEREGDGERRVVGGTVVGEEASLLIFISLARLLPPLYSRCCRVLMHNRVSSLDARLNTCIYALSS